jgi:23S rRNA pseudouridine1911/1915/1917 synthase
MLAVDKPAGIPTMGAAAGRTSLIGLARQYLKRRYRKPGNVYLGVVSRLDAPVTGVVLFARTSKAADRLNRQFAAGQTIKTYWAIVEHKPDPPEGKCHDWLLHDDARRKVVVQSRSCPGAKEAHLSYRVLRPVGGRTLIEVLLETGRKHQIRVQLAHRGWPIVGDTKYGAERPFPQGIALHARRLEIVHPVRQGPLIIETPPPNYWKLSLDSLAKTQDDDEGES